MPSTASSKLDLSQSPAWQLRRWRWWAAGACAALGFFLEWLEHQVPLGIVDGVELLGYGLLLPALMWVVMTLLARSLADQADAAALHARQQQVSDQLDQYHDWHELTQFIVRLPGNLLPVKRAILYSYDHPAARFQPAASWPDSNLSAPAMAGHTADCKVCLQTQAPHFRPDVEEYCQPLAYGGLLIGTLRLEFPASGSIDRAQLAFLNSMAARLALAFATSIARPQAETQVQTLARLDERRQLAYALHDSLAQHISYLHLSLDRLAACDEDLLPDAVRQELLSLREVASEAYHEVRDQLTVLHSHEGADLIRSLARYTQRMTRRSKVRVSLVTHGDPTQLPAGLHAHVFGVVRECLNNVQKHARAYESQVMLFWAEDLLVVTVTDDGVGFDATAIHSAEHHGLAMLRERTAQFNGQLHIHSTPGRGSRLIFYLPLEHASTEAARSREAQFN
jgi:signal transduction histidine kinase